MSYDKSLIAHKLQRWDQYITDYHLPQWESIPDFGLYMDQVVLLLERYLSFIPPVNEEKERIVTERLMSILSREAAAIDDIRLVIQGTNVTDTLYRPHTGSTIDGLPIIEPVRELFKDEIRQVGQELGMPAVLVNRQPFPGSGLASRIMADVTAERLDILHFCRNDLLLRQTEFWNTIA